jgi:hypothetical protein
MVQLCPGFRLWMAPVLTTQSCPLLPAEHLSSRRLNAAFEAALSSGMDTLMWLLRQTSPSAVFSQDPCPLSQVRACVRVCAMR